MSLRLYLAMTDAEIRSAASLPRHLAFMACHFSPYGAGLTNIPQRLPPESILIVNDRVPVLHHDPALIFRQLKSAVERLKVFGVLLDFQIGNIPLTSQIVKTLVDGLPCPVAVSPAYGAALSCPLFSAPALHQRFCDLVPLKKGRSLWLDTYEETANYKVTATGCHIDEGIYPADTRFFDEELQCSYGLSIEKDCAGFTLSRKAEEIPKYLRAAEQAGITVAVGLYQQLSHIPAFSSNSPPQKEMPPRG
ncbi:MAG: hypothetical protein E7461_02995 [Ruminococcaceae bacterium]|nr:hypothetical protein [Oscillospiraceae bacterium]